MFLYIHSYLYRKLSILTRNGYRNFLTSSSNLDKNDDSGGVSQSSSMDPLKKLFLEKIKEYREKSDGGKKFLEATPEFEATYKAELEAITAKFGMVSGVDPTKFPTFTFKDPPLDPIDLEIKQPKGKEKEEAKDKPGDKGKK